MNFVYKAIKYSQFCSNDITNLKMRQQYLSLRRNADSTSQSWIQHANSRHMLAYSETEMTSFDEIFIIGWTESCHLTTFGKAMWRKFRQNDICVSAYICSLCATSNQPHRDLFKACQTLSHKDFVKLQSAETLLLKRGDLASFWLRSPQFRCDHRGCEK